LLVGLSQYFQEFEVDQLEELEQFQELDHLEALWGALLEQHEPPPVAQD